MRRHLLTLTCIVLLVCSSVFFPGGSAQAQQRKVTLSGYVRDASSGEMVIGAVVNPAASTVGAVTNTYGFYSLELPAGSYRICCSSLGYASDTLQIDLTAARKQDFSLKPETLALDEAVVVATSKQDRLRKAEMGVASISGNLAKMVPVLFGETDIIKVIQMMPGVQSPSEGSTGFSVRGGGVDQNLILMDEAPVYNAGHFLGFFSVFNNDAVKTADLYKGDIAAKYGGRLSSLLDVHTIDGNLQEFGGSASIGLISSKLLLEGPVVREKASFMVAARRTYIDLFFPLFKGLKGDRMFFYDVNAKANWIIDDNNRIYLSVFSGEDIFGLHNSDMTDIDMEMNFSNNTQSLRWNHVFSPKLFANFTLLNSLYDYGMQLKYSATDIDFLSHLNSQGGKADFTLYADSRNTVGFGVQATRYSISPAELSPETEGIFGEYAYPETHAAEEGVYLQNDMKAASWLSLRYGVRVSHFSTFGQAFQRYYLPDHSLDRIVEFARGRRIKDWWGFEPRLSSSFNLSRSFSIKAAYSRNVQYIQQAVFSISGSPLDIWFTASPNVRPQISDQFSFGLFKNFARDALETSVELFYKDNKNTIDFKDHPDVIMNEDMEAELRSGSSYACGAEFMVKYDWKKFNGWVGYTWSKAQYKIPEINGGRPYDSPMNHRHSLSVVASYSFTKRLSASADWVYYSGAPTTYPAGVYEVGGARIPLYSDRNEDKFPDYHRLDLSLTLQGGRVPVGERWHGEWNLSVYNVYSRHNAWALDFRYDDAGELHTSKYYLFTIVPSLSYTLKF